MLPRWLGAHGNFDGSHYVHIAKNDYGLHQEAFFPLYPLLIHLFSLHVNPFVVGLLISLLCAYIAWIVWANICEETSPNRDIKKDHEETKCTIMFIFVWCSMPGAIFFTAVYTESLFLCLLGIYTWSLMHNKKIMGAISGFLLGLTRFSGAFAGLMYLLHAGWHWKKENKTSWTIWGSLMPVMGLLTYMGYLWHETGDPIAFINAQKGFGNERSTSLILIPQVLYRYMKIFFTAQVNQQYLVAVLEFASFVSVGIALIWGCWRWCQRHTIKHIVKPQIVLIGIWIYSVVNLMLPTVTGTLSSIPRYALASVAYPLIISHYMPYRVARLIILTQFVIQIFEAARHTTQLTSVFRKFFNTFPRFFNHFLKCDETIR
jgi:hypothetical protein